MHNYTKSHTDIKQWLKDRKAERQSDIVWLSVSTFVGTFTILYFAGHLLAFLVK